MSARAACLLLPCCLLLVQCGMVQKVRSLGRKGDGAEQDAFDPQKRGWALMMSDAEFAKFKQGASTGSSAPGDATGIGASQGTEAGLFDFSNIMQNQGAGTAGVAWQRSATVAAKQARLTGMPLLFYATHRSSKPAQDMERTLMAAPAFRTLVQESFVPLLMDFSDPETTRSPLYRDLKARLSIRGYPVLIVTLPDSSEVSRLTGYKRESEKSCLESLQEATRRAARLGSERREKLEKKDGYRLWKNKDGKPVFAKLTALDANMGTFTTEWGESFKTFLTRLSAEDQSWIAERRKPEIPRAGE
jgi:hypothetical protein